MSPLALLFPYEVTFRLLTVENKGFAKISGDKVLFKIVKYPEWLTLGCWKYPGRLK